VAWSEKIYMNAELLQKALDKVGNINTLINLVSRRVRQLSAGGGGISRPLVPDTASLGSADIALREIIEEKIGWEMPTLEEWSLPVKRKRSRTKPAPKSTRPSLSSVINAVAA
jgi:DNA-directed RNA polymerase subunit K/omega